MKITEKNVTYKDIQEYVKKEYGYRPKKSWIGHVKELCGVPLKKTWNKKRKRKQPCPSTKIESIKKAFKHFGIKKN